MTKFYNQVDLPIASEDRTVTVTLDHGVKVRRKVMAGSRIPPDLIQPYEDVAAAMGSAAASTGEPAKHRTSRRPASG